VGVVLSDIAKSVRRCPYGEIIRGSRLAHKIFHWATATHSGYYISKRVFLGMVDIIPTIETKHERWFTGDEERFVMMCFPELFSNEQCWRAGHWMMEPAGYYTTPQSILYNTKRSLFEEESKDKWELRAYASVATGYELNLRRFGDKKRRIVVANRIPDVIISDREIERIKSGLAA
jgi:hypothetical protein